MTKSLRVGSSGPALSAVGERVDVEPNVRPRAATLRELRSS
jgi:hypothetical protein